MCGLLAGSNGCPDNGEKSRSNRSAVNVGVFKRRPVANDMHTLETMEFFFRMYLLRREYPLLLKVCTCK